jgi:hypothetical protein
MIVQRHFSTISLVALGAVAAIASPAQALDLTASNSFGFASGTPASPQAFFQQTSSSGAGTGALDSFLRIQAPGGPDNTEEGYNTDNRPVEFDEKTDPNFTRSLLLSSIPQVTLGSTQYREFVLDINEPGGGQSTIDLTALKIFQSATANSISSPFPGADQIYDLTETVLMKDLNSGSGSIDYAVYIPSSLFNTKQYVTLYSKFENAQGGFEEWAVNKGAAGEDNQIPTPAMLPGLIGMGMHAVRQKRKQQATTIA